MADDSRFRSRAVLALATLAVVCSNSAADARRHGTGLGPIAYDRPAPNFAFVDTISPAPVPASLESLRGRPIVLNFWASYCEPCVDELDAFAKLRKNYGDRVAFVTVSDQPRDVVAEALAAKGIDSIAVIDPGRKVFGLYGVSAIPVTLVLSADETVRYVSVGELDWNELRAAVDAAKP